MNGMMIMWLVMLVVFSELVSFDSVIGFLYLLLWLLLVSNIVGLLLCFMMVIGIMIVFYVELLCE